jgi:hypothetical protein
MIPDEEIPLPPQDDLFMDEVRRKLIPSLNYIGLEDLVNNCLDNYNY